LLFDHLKYDDTPVINNATKVTEHTKIALIDSGNSSIQIPKAEFRRIQSVMMGSEPTLVEITLPDGRTQLGSPKPCTEISANFANLKFKIH